MKMTEKEKIIETLREDIERKTRIIKKLREENTVLMKTAIKNARRLREQQDHFSPK